MTVVTTQTPEWVIEDPLAQASRRILLTHQADSGALVASPNFATYAYSWLRDGSFCALALDVVGEREAAERFHDWTARVVVSMAGRVQRIAEQAWRGDAPDRDLLLPTRYTLDGQVEKDEADEIWPNVQFDGYGTWLFSLASHLDGAPLPPRWRKAVETAAVYLVSTWQLPCYDYWEEYGERRHTSTLAAIAAGLRAAATLLDDPQLNDIADDVLGDMLATCRADGRFSKGPEDDRVDASLLSLSVPFGLVTVGDPTMQATVAAVAADLVPTSGGVRRYVGDTYYGGGSWVLLACWLGWSAALTGDEDTYHSMAGWTRDQADADGGLPEQVLDEVQDPSFIDEWKQRWGQVADPLLWSHAMYLLMQQAAVARWS